MAPKTEIKKLDDKKRCQVIFSKRRIAFMKLAKEFSIWCDVDFACVMISPCGRVHKFSTKTSVENVMYRYVNLPVDKRLIQISNAKEIGEKLEKLRQLQHIEGDGNKLEHLDKQIENLEQEMQKRQKEIKRSEDDLRNYEPYMEKERFLHQLSWSERRVKQSWERVTTRKRALLGSRSNFSTSSSDGQPSRQVKRTNRRSIPKIRASKVAPFERRRGDGVIDLRETGTEPGILPVSHNNIAIGKELVISSSAPNPSNHNRQLLMELDPWISPYSSRVRKSLLDELSGKGKEKQVAYEATPSAAAAATAGTSKFSIQGFPATPSQQNSAEDALQALFPQPHIPMQGMDGRQKTPIGLEGIGSAIAGLQTMHQQGNSLQGNVLTPKPPTNIQMQGQKTPIGAGGAGLSCMEYQQGNSARTRGALIPQSNNTIQMHQSWKANRSQSTFLNQSLVTSQSSLVGQQTPIGVQASRLSSMGQLVNSAETLIPTSNSTIQMQGINANQNLPTGIQGHQAEFGHIAPLGVQQHHPSQTFDSNMISPLGLQHPPQTFDHNMGMIIRNSTSFGVDEVSIIQSPTLGQQGVNGFVANPTWTEGMQDAKLWEWEELIAQVGQPCNFP